MYPTSPKSKTFGRRVDFRTARSTLGCTTTSTGGNEMSFQAYLDKVEEKTGKTPRELVEEAKGRGYDAKDVKAGVICDWLKADYDLGRGHAMALVHVIKNGPQISDKHVGTNGTHSDPSNMLWLDGKATNPLTA
jgi:hypothetical protein